MATAKLLYRRLDALFGSLEDRTLAGEADRGLRRGRAREPERRSSPACGGLVYAERRDNFALLKRVGEPGTPVAETLDPALTPLAELARHRVYIFAIARGGGLAAAARSPAHGRRRGPDRGPAPEAPRDPVPARRRLGARGARLRAQHRPRRARLAADGRARARRVPRGGRDPAEPAGRGAAGLRRLRPRGALACRPRRWAATSTTSALRRRACSGSRSATPAATGCPRRCSCATWSRACAWASRRS